MEKAVFGWKCVAITYEQDEVLKRGLRNGMHKYKRTFKLKPLYTGLSSSQRIFTAKAGAWLFGSSDLRRCAARKGICRPVLSAAAGRQRSFSRVTAETVTTAGDKSAQMAGPETVRGGQVA